MVKLVDLDPPVAHVLLDRLEEAGIVATTTDIDRGTGGVSILQSGGLMLRVWIHDPARRPEAESIVRRVLTTPEVVPTCTGCGYDLGGHRGHVRCPECGLEVIAETPEGEGDCPDCGEPVPRGFELCWHCGALMDSESTPSAEGPADVSGIGTTTGTCRRCGRPASAGRSTCGDCRVPVGGASRRREAIGGLSAATWILILLSTSAVVAALGWWLT